MEYNNTRWSFAIPFLSLLQHRVLVETIDSIQLLVDFSVFVAYESTAQSMFLWVLHGQKQYVQYVVPAGVVYCVLNVVDDSLQGVGTDEY